MWGDATLEMVRSTEHDREQHPTWDLAMQLDLVRERSFIIRLAHRRQMP